MYRSHTHTHTCFSRVLGFKMFYISSRDIHSKSGLTRDALNRIDAGFKFSIRSEPRLRVLKSISRYYDDYQSILKTLFFSSKCTLTLHFAPSSFKMIHNFLTDLYNILHNVLTNSQLFFFPTLYLHFCSTSLRCSFIISYY